MSSQRGPIDPAEFRLMRRYIESQCGLHLSDDKTYLVESRLTPIMAELGCRSFFELHTRASADATHAVRDRIIDALTTHETLWFRDTAPFEYLEAALLPELAATAVSQRRRGRIWCAACSTGQEPYSVALTVLEAARRGVIAPAQVEVVATDVSPSALYLARAGRYDPFAMGRGMQPQLRDRYFTQSGGAWVVCDEARRLVRFERQNLQDPFGGLGTFDVVFCRNVLMYFADDLRHEILARLHAALRPGGHLILGATESPAQPGTRFDMVRHGRAIYYRAA